MKKFCLSIASLMLSTLLVAQNWSGTTPGNIFYNHGNVGIGITNPNARLEVLNEMRVRLSIDQPEKNVAGIFPIGISGATGAINWAVRGVYQYSNGVANNSSGGDLDIIKSWNGNTVLGTKRDGLPLGNVGIGITNPNARLEVLNEMRVRLSIDQPEKNVAGIFPIGISGATGAINWAVRGVYQYSNGVANNSSGGDLDIIKSWNGNTVLGTKRDGLPLGNVGIGITNPNARLEVLNEMRVRLSIDQPEKNVAGIFPIGISGATGAINWAVRGVYQYSNGVANNSSGGDLDIIKSWNGNTVLGTKRDGSPLGNVGIGTTDPKNTLSVNGSIWAREVKVSLTDAADWVFEDDYELKPLEEVEKFIMSNKHLPEIPSAEEFRRNDLNVAEMDNKLLQKVEELTLYLIDQHKENKAQRGLIETQKAQIEQLLKRVTELENQ